MSEGRQGVLARFGNVHRTIHGDPDAVIRRILDTSEAMLWDRGATRVDRSPDPVEAMTDEDGLVMTGWVEEVRRWDVYVHSEDRVGVKFARAVQEACDAAGSRGIVVSVEGPTPFTRRECGGAIQFLNASEMCVNVTRHCLVPKHERVEAADLPGGVEVGSLPRLFETDRVAQYYDWGPGTLVRITRLFGGSEPIPYYRVVVAV